jgi:hypothetical protein
MIFGCQTCDFADGIPPIFIGQALLREVVGLGSKQAEPYLPGFGAARPKRSELSQIPWPLQQLPRHRAVDNHLVTGDVLDQSLVGCRRTAAVVFRGQTVNRHHQVEVAICGPGSRNRTDGTGYNLHLHVAEQWDQSVEFPEPDERFTPHKADMQGTQLLCECHDPFH